MKKLIITLTILAVFVGGFFMLIKNFNVNRIGADPYYVQVQEGKKVQVRTSGGDMVDSYLYHTKAYDKNGSEKTVDFSAIKMLRKDAYLRVYTKGSGVSSYEEVKQDEVPSKALEKLKAK
ncbi:YxeA family protein [Paenibacillus aestuarii]|uniref:YxeA family protein n=1 Tax=Paenibacillus aestuarii TaxID=516965 RepID=A0ABW0KBU8_9BACL|nr:YxeA family protein [Paenibacillus aestuarii]